jgi:hypothetical protein
MTLQSKTVKELKAMARGKIKGFSTMRKAQLIEALGGATKFKKGRIVKKAVAPAPEEPKKRKKRFVKKSVAPAPAPEQRPKRRGASEREIKQFKQRRRDESCSDTVNDIETAGKNLKKGSFYKVANGLYPALSGLKLDCSNTNNANIKRIAEKFIIDFKKSKYRKGSFLQKILDISTKDYKPAIKKILG